MERKAGAVVGSCEVLAPLGAGGLGVVSRAKGLRIGREIAIEILPRSYADNAGRLRRFHPGS